MTLFDERERAFEQRFVQEEAQRFRARSRRNRHLAEWACTRMGLAGRAAAAYVEAFTDAGMLARDADLAARLRADLQGAGIEASLPELQAEMERAAAVRP